VYWGVFPVLLYLDIVLACSNDLFLYLKALCCGVLRALISSTDSHAAYNMQIQSNSGCQNVSSPIYRLTGNVCAYKSPDSRIPAPSRTHYEALPGPKSILPNTSRGLTSAHPAGSWLERVLGLFDPALRDAEDMMLSLPYTAIREKTITLALVLDELSSSSMGSAANRQFSGSGPYSKAPGSVAYVAKCLASRSLSAQDPDLVVITKAMCVIIAPATV
jgi:hypothetical protein